MTSKSGHVGHDALTRIRVVSWNTEWRRPDSRDGKEILKRLQDLDADIICLTETHFDMFSGWPGAVVDGGPNPFNVKEPSRRTVLLWTRSRWSETARKGGSQMRVGCFVRGETSTSDGPATVVGVVIPYHMSDVRYGAKNRSIWENHERYLDDLLQLTPALPANAMVIGDYNQRLPATFPPPLLREKLLNALSGMNVTTSGIVGPDGKRSNDHIACGQAWKCEATGVISNVGDRGGQLSDHFGVWADLVPTAG